MKLHVFLAALWLATGAAATVVAQGAQGTQVNRPEPQFRVERPVAPARGPHRLRVDVPVLLGSQSRTFDDLRLFNAAGVEIPRLLVPVSAPESVWETGRIAAIPRTLKTSGFEVDLGALSAIDRIRLKGIPGPFMKLANLEGSGDRRHWTVLIDQTTVFDLPDNGLQQLELGFPAGAYRYIRVAWNDTNSARAPLPAGVDARKAATEVQETQPLTAAVALAPRPSEPGKSRYQLHLPAGRLPIVALQLNAEGDYVLRRATVTEPRLTSGEVVPFVIGSALLRRDARGDSAAGPLRIPVAASAEPDVELVIEDGDNPPLTLNSVTAIFADQPWIYFEGDDGAIVARYGDPQLAAPHYDLEAARASIHIERVPDARWGSPRDLAPAAPAPPATPMPTGGAPIDQALFRYVRGIAPGEAGLIALPLDAAVLSHSRGPANRFADVRVLDGNSRQVPYVLERRDEPLVINLAVESRDAPANSHTVQEPGLTSYYRIRLPFSKLPSPRLVLTGPSRLFDRTVRVVVERPPDERHRDIWIEPLASSRWTHVSRDSTAPSLTLRLPNVDATDLLIIVAEGDNSRLPIASAQLLLPAYRVRLFRENAAATLRMAYGRDDLAPPSYDLALLAPQVLGVAAREIAVAQEEPGPASHVSGAAAALRSPRLFWAVLIAAVFVLIALLARLLNPR